MLNKLKENKMKKLPEKVQRQLRELSYDDLCLVFVDIIEKQNIEKETKSMIVAYIEKRLKRLQKQNDYNDISIPDHEYIAKWGVK